MHNSSALFSHLLGLIKMFRYLHLLIRTLSERNNSFSGRSVKYSLGQYKRQTGRLIKERQLADGKGGGGGAK